MKIQDFERLFILMAMLTALLSASASAQNVNAAANGALSIISLQVSPQPVIAGENVTVTFQLYNSYTNPLSYVNLQLSASNPIINVSPSSQVLVTTIGQGLYGGGIGEGTFQYNFRIPSTLHAGEYTIDVIANYQTSQPNSYGGTSVLPAESIMPINIYVYGTPSIQLSANPQSAIVPGQSTSIPISVVNTGTDIANNVTVTLHNSEYFKVFGSYQYSLGSIGSPGVSSFIATIQPSLNITNGTYPVSVTITYKAQSGNLVSENTTIGLSTLINTPDIFASIESATPTNLYSGGNQTLDVQIQNIGLGTAKNITARFASAAGINVGSISQFFIPSLSPKNSTTEMVYISANRSYSNASVSLPLYLMYYTSNYKSNYTNIQYMPINIQRSALFNITGVTGTLSPGEAYAPVIFRIKNIGNIEAQQLTLSLQTTFPITPVNPNIYINSLAPGQSVNATFYVGVDPSANAGSYPVTVYEQWRQPNGAVSQIFSGSNGYYSTVSGGSSSGYTSYIIPAVAVIAVIAVVAFVVRRRKGAKRKA